MDAKQATAKVRADAHKGHSKRSRIFAAAFMLMLVAFAGCVLWLNAGIERVPLRPTGGSQFAKATVDEVLTSDVGLSDSGEMQGNQRVLLTITDGQFAGNQVEATSPYSNNSGAYCEPGLHVVVLVNQGQDGALVATVYNYDRGLVLWGLIGLFLVLLCAVGGKSGTLSAVGLADL